MQAVEQIKQKENRRYQRRSIKVRATIHSEHLPFSEGEIRDFCEDGLYLTFDDPIDSSTTSIDAIPAVLIRFASLLNGKQEFVQVNVRPVHFTRSGFGGFFVNPGERVLQSLRALASIQLDTKYNSQSTTVVDSSIRDDINAEINLEIQNAANRTLSEFFNTIQPELESAAEHAESNSHAADYLDTVVKLNENQDRLARYFGESLLAQMDSNCSNASAQAEPSNESTTLALIDKPDFEDWLVLSDVINKNRSVHTSILSELDQKIAVLNNQHASGYHNPADPAMFCESFRETVDKIELDHQAKHQIYQIFGRCLNHQLRSLYSTLKRCLEPIALPLDKPKNQQTLARISKTQEKHPTLRPAQSDSENYKTATLFDRFKRFNQIDASLGAVDSFNDTQRDEQSNHGLPTSVSECSTTKVLMALKEIAATEVHNDFAPDTGELESKILDKIVTAATNLGGPSQSEQTDLAFAAKFYDTLNKQTADSTLGDLLRKQLRLPLLNLVVRHNQFLKDSNHPGWKILDLLERLSTSFRGCNELNEGEIRQSFDNIIDKFTATSGADHAEFESIRDELKDIVTPLETKRFQRVERIRRSYEGRQRFQKARAFVQSRLDDRIAGRSVPRILLLLLDSGLEHLFILSLLHSDTDRDLFESRLNRFDTLSALLTDPKRLQAAPLDDLRALLHLIDQDLSVACSDLSQQNQIMNELTSLLLGVGDPPARTEPVMTIPEPRSSTRLDAENLPIELRGYANQAKAFDIGDWLMFNLDGQERQPLNLVWKEEDPWLFVFVNSKGRKVKELNLESLAGYLKEGRVWKIENLDIPLSERTFSAMLQNMHDNLIHRSTIDERTGLINRKNYCKQLQQEYALLDDDDCGHYLCYFEIDQIQWINRACGIEAVDSVLKTIVSTIKSTIDKQDLFGQFGDQTFGILYKFRSAKQAPRACENLREAIKGFAFDWNEHNFPIGISIGLAPFVKQDHGFSAILAQADGACTAAKNSGCNQIQIYEQNADKIKIQDRIYEWVGRISNVISQNQLFTRAQLIAPINVTQNHLPHYEILLGIKEQSGKIVPPDEFIPVAEYCGRISEIDRWVVNHVLDWMESNQEKMESIEGFSINLSGNSVISKEFLEFIEHQFRSRHVDPKKITFEITETAAVTNLSTAQEFISKIRRYGCKFSLDDFGSGYSSYAYLKHLDVDYLKIDGTFVKDLVHSNADYAMVKSMNEIGHSLNMETIAEYVENEAILEKLREIGVDQVQGYGIKRPALLSEL